MHQYKNNAKLNFYNYSYFIRFILEAKLLMKYIRAVGVILFSYRSQRPDENWYKN